MLRCWKCRSLFRPDWILRDGILRPRSERRGGPFRTYRCPSCFAMSKVETTRRHRWFASPDKDLSIADFLFGWAGLLSPEDFLTLAEWKREFSERRRAFFEVDGDRRYSRGRIGSFVEWILPRRDPTKRSKRGGEERFDPGDAWREGRDSKQRRRADSKSEPKREEKREREKEPEPREIPHPYRILGLSPEASEEEIRRAFRDLARRYHPDKLRGHEEEVIERANDRLRELIDAYESLVSERRNSARKDR